MDSSLTGDTSTVMNKEEHYEVIDECTEVEVLEITKDSQAEVTTGPKFDTTQQNSETGISDIKSHDNNTDKLGPIKMECDQELNNDTTDFTADISLDQFDGQKEVTDEDVMHHLDVIENIELDPETFGIDECMKEINQSELFTKERNEQEKDKNEMTVIEEELIEEKWYEQKLAEKSALLKERLSKLARVLTASYPSYVKWLERIEKIQGSPICKIDPIRRCSLKKPDTNRWKFQCKKNIQESIKQESNPDASSSSFKVVWHLDQIGIGGANIDHTIKLPSFVLKAIKRQQLCAIVEQ